MAVEYGDPKSGFRHIEVIRFINNEILMNGGGQDFYLTFRSRSWNEIEDGLHNILGDQQIPRNHKRACAWSALSLAVRVAAGQREQHIRHVRQLKEQLANREAVSWALASELQQLCQQRDQATTQLHFTRSFLQQAQTECDMLRGRLFQFERCVQIAPLAQDIVPGLGAEQLGAAAWPLNTGQQRDVWAMGEYSGLLFENPVAAPTSAVYLPSSWVPTMMPPFPGLVPQAFPLQAPFPMRLPSLPPQTPTTVTETEAGVQLQMPPVEIDPPGLSAGGGVQEEVVPLWDQSCYNQVEGPEMPQGSSVFLGDNQSFNQEDLKMPHGMLFLGKSGYFKQEEKLERSLGMAPQEYIGNYNQEEGLPWSQGMLFLGENWQYSPKEDQVRPQEMVYLGDNINCNQEDGQEGTWVMTPPGFSSIHCQAESIEKAQDNMTYVGRSYSRGKGTESIQAMIFPGTRRSHNQGGVEKAQVAISSELSRNQEDEERLQCMIPSGLRNLYQEKSAERAKEITLWKSWSESVKESPRKQQPKLQKTDQTEEKKAQVVQQEEKSVSYYTPVNWVCTCCKGINLPWHMTCYKCKTICTQVESGDTDPGQTH